MCHCRYLEQTDAGLLGFGVGEDDEEGEEGEEESEEEGSGAREGLDGVEGVLKGSVSLLSAWGSALTHKS